MRFNLKLKALRERFNIAGETWYTLSYTKLFFVVVVMFLVRSCR